jgi:hypothetical protein
VGLAGEVDDDVHTSEGPGRNGIGGEVAREVGKRGRTLNIEL